MRVALQDCYNSGRDARCSIASGVILLARSIGITRRSTIRVRRGLLQTLSKDGKASAIASSSSKTFWSVRELRIVPGEKNGSLSNCSVDRVGSSRSIKSTQTYSQVNKSDQPER